jgi:pimeloyl-ACP methyl ester carboxylesterase
VTDDRPPLLLLHGVAMSARVWDGVRPLLETRFRLLVPTALGHRGGAVPRRRPVRVMDVVDDAERALDGLGLDRVHAVGNSMGGWMAIELARRGRAATATAFAPAGFWTPGAPDQTSGVRKIRRTMRATRLIRPAAPALMRSATFRRVALRDGAVHGERLTPRQALEAGDDLLGCAAADDVLATPERVEPLDPLPCPVLIAWSAKDRIFPLGVNDRVARERLPAAHTIVLPDVVHVPMIDDPGLVATTIIDAIAVSTPAVNLD